MNLICAYCGIQFVADRGVAAHRRRVGGRRRRWRHVVVALLSIAGLIAGAVAVRSLLR